MKRRDFINRTPAMACMAAFLPGFLTDIHFMERPDPVITVRGKVKADKIGFTLTHEHLLVDFIGAGKYDPERWNDEEVIQSVLPYLEEIRTLGCKTFIDCTPEYIGRDPSLLLKLSEASGMNIVTNTGLYGAADNKYIPEYAYRESSVQLSDRWIREFEEGIGGTPIRPGFMKIGVAPGPLSEFHKKLVSAAALAHLKTGMTIASHTGPSVPAFGELKVLEEAGVHPEAFIWVHAQNEQDEEKHLQAAEMGAWVSLDGLSTENGDQYISWLKNFKKNDLLQKVLISHDAGW
ncbi:MAG: phosphotriesterase, partial [Cyclobacteriaceae bacterium]|nr:phosphotriesterase [Cyclobacteriaceae bacterium]